MIRFAITSVPAIMGDPRTVQAEAAKTKERILRSLGAFAQAEVVHEIGASVPPPINTGKMRRDFGVKYGENRVEVAPSPATYATAVAQEVGRRPGAKGPPLPPASSIGLAGFGAATTAAGLFEEATDPIGWWVRRKLAHVTFEGVGFGSRRVSRKFGGSRGLQIRGPGRGRRASPAQRKARAALSLRYLVWRKIHTRGFRGKFFVARARRTVDARGPLLVRSEIAAMLARLRGGRPPRGRP